MSLTCPLRLVPALYDAQTRLALSPMWRQQPASPFAMQILAISPAGGRRRGLTTRLLAARPQLSDVCATVLARDTVLQAVLEEHLERMDCKAQTRFAVHAFYYPDGIGLIAADMTGKAGAWTRGTIGRGIRLICEPVETQAEAIARHDDYVCMIRDFGDTVRVYDPLLAAQLRFAGVGALLSRERRPRGRTAAGPARQGDLLQLRAGR